jgi:uncharacterized damage-inducible protein DinB
MRSVLTRRSFLRSSTLAAAGACFLGPWNSVKAAPPMVSGDLLKVGPMQGYTPHVGTLVSMLNYNRETIIEAVKSLTMVELDYLQDRKANTIGSLLLHLAAIEKVYQVNTFEGRDEFSESEKKKWEVASNLGQKAREQIKGHDVKYYLDVMGDVRQKTLEELKKRDDTWLLAVDPKSTPENPVNTYWKWFHVCEHESNHRGQITWLKRRLPGASDQEE